MRHARIAVIVTAMAALCPVASGASPRELPVRGRVVDSAGQGVAGLTVRLLQGRRELDIRQWAFADEVVDSVVARTDAAGFFEVMARPDPEYRYYWLRFHDADEFDVVRYRVPEDREITDRVRAGRPVTELVVLEDHPDWERVRGWIETLGAGSDRGKLVRRLGIPDRREQAGGVESFWYEGPGVVYRFEQGQFVGEERIAAGDESR